MDNCKQPASTGSTFVAVSHQAASRLISRGPVQVRSSPFLA